MAFVSEQQQPTVSPLRVLRTQEILLLRRREVAKYCESNISPSDTFSFAQLRTSNFFVAE